MKTCTVGEHSNCVEMCSGDFRIAITQDYGPRVIGGFMSLSDNFFRVLPNKPMDNIGTGFKLYGGHRLWHSPEAAPRSYAPDNSPVDVKKIDDGYVFDCAPEALTGIKKTISISSGDDNTFILTHILTNCGQWNVTMAPWALSIMAPGGVAVIPQGRDTTRNPFAPDRSLVMWPYCSMGDYRLSLEDDFILLRQDPAAKSPIKIGYFARDGWIAYVNKGFALVKSIETFEPGEVEHPDNGCNLESYSCADFCEIETLAPLYELASGESCEHEEVWQGISGLPEIKNSDDVKKYLLPQIKSLK